jgi:hypothetical protein
MMDWNQLQQRWQQQAPAGIEAPSLDSVRRRDELLRATVRRRNRIETAVALLLFPVFAFAAWRAGLRGAFESAFFSTWLAVWTLYVPWTLWRTRSIQPQRSADVAVLDYLRQEREATLAQARLLEQAWLWYVLPCAIGVIGLNFAALGSRPMTWIYAGVVVTFSIAIALLNRRVARTELRSHAADLEHHIDRLTHEDQLT